jgi:hypothetical protein
VSVSDVSGQRHNFISHWQGDSVQPWFKMSSARRLRGTWPGTPPSQLAEICQGVQGRIRSLAAESVRGACHAASMINFVASSATSLFDKYSGSLLKRLPTLVGSILMSLAVLSVPLGRHPLTLADEAARWLGLTWSTDPVASWLAARATGMTYAGGLLAIAAVLGVHLYGGDQWLGSTRGPVGLAAALALWLQVDAPLELRVATFVSLAYFAWRSRHDLQSVFSATVLPLILLPFVAVSIVTAMLGYSHRLLSEPGPERLHMVDPGEPGALRSEGLKQAT